VINNLQGLLAAELLVTLAVVAVMSIRQGLRWWLFQKRRRANMRLSDLPVASTLTVAARGVLDTNVWQQFANDTKFLRENSVTPSELEALGRASFMGNVECKEDMMFILRAIRGNDQPAKQKQKLLA
jgi:hypothetical protein